MIDFSVNQLHYVGTLNVTIVFHAT